MRALALAVAALVVAAPAAAPTTRTDRVTAKVHKTGRDSRGLIYKGTVRSRVFGRGTVVEHVGGLLRGTFTITYRRGKVRGTSVAHAKPEGDGTVSFTGTYRLTGGTGAYRRIRGKGTFRGHGSSDFSTATFTQSGRVSY
jgi:hypothetical protein